MPRRISSTSSTPARTIRIARSAAIPNGTKSIGFISHLRANPTTHVRHLRNGKLAHDGAGQAFWYRPLNSSLSEIPVDDREQPLLFHGRTVDYQDVAVQATVTYRVIDPDLASTRLDF